MTPAFRYQMLRRMDARVCRWKRSVEPPNMTAIASCRSLAVLTHSPYGFNIAKLARQAATADSNEVTEPPLMFVSSSRNSSISELS